MAIEHLTPSYLQAHTDTPFAAVLEYIATHYRYTPFAFHNGSKLNLASENQGSAKVLYFAQLQKWSAQDTLLLFAEHYCDVLNNPTSTSHENIRQFMQNGWEGVSFDGIILQPIS